MAELTLDRMAAGGIHDQLAGGFHRYAVDAIWLVPHFEKMLYDNALLARAYLQAFEATGAPRHAEVAASTLDYLVRELRLPHGGYASATDADTDGVEGSTFVWTPDEVRELLGDDAALVEALYDITPAGNFEGATVLSRVHRARRGERRARACRPSGCPSSGARMLEARARRPQPALDDKALASWNGMALAALAEGARVLDRPDLLEAAEQCAAFLLGPAVAPGRLALALPSRGPQLGPRLPRRPRAGRRGAVAAPPRDARSALAGRGATARAAGRRALLRPRGPRLVRHAADGEELVARPRTLDDAPTPSGASTLAGLLVRLARLDGDDALEARARAVVADAGDLPARAPTGVREPPLRRERAARRHRDRRDRRSRRRSGGARARSRGSRGVGARDGRLARSRPRHRVRRAARSLRLPWQHVSTAGAGRGRAACRADAVLTRQPNAHGRAWCRTHGACTL